MDDKARERGNREIKESIENFRKDFAAIDADVSDLKSRMEKTKAVSFSKWVQHLLWWIIAMTRNESMKSAFRIHPAVSGHELCDIDRV